MLVAPCERTTTGRGCLFGRGPAVRVADPEEADPAHPQRGHAQGAAMWDLLAKLLQPQTLLLTQGHNYRASP